MYIELFNLRDEGGVAFRIRDFHMIGNIVRVKLADENWYALKGAPQDAKANPHLDDFEFGGAFYSDIGVTLKPMAGFKVVAWKTAMANMTEM